MTKIGLFYGSKRGNTLDAAERIRDEFNSIHNGIITIYNIKKVNIQQQFSAHEKLIFGSSTWEDGNLQQHWLRTFPQMDSVDLHGKQVAVFGLGDQYEFSTTFQGAIGILAHKARERGAELVGFWPTDGYTFQESPAVENGKFLGLALDNTTQRELTKDRIKAWVEQLAKEFDIVT